MLNSIHVCIVQETTKCSDPTPANILDALIIQILKVTPCWQIKQKQVEKQEALAASGNDAASTSGASNIGGLVKNALGNIRPVVMAGVVGCTAGIGAVLDTLFSHALSVVMVMASVVLSWLTYCCCAVEQIFNTVSEILLKNGQICSFIDMFKDWKKDLFSAQENAGGGGWDGFLVHFCPISCVSVSGVLLVALAGLTAANILI